MVYNHAQTCWSSNGNLDIGYTVSFIHRLQMFQSLYIVFGVLLILYNTQIGLIIYLTLSLTNFITNLCNTLNIYTYVGGMAHAYPS